MPFLRLAVLVSLVGNAVLGTVFWQRTAGCDETLVRAIVWSRLANRTNGDATAIAAARYWRKKAMRLQMYRRLSREPRADQVSTDITAFEALFGEKPFKLFSPAASDNYAARQGLHPGPQPLTLHFSAPL